MTLHSQRYGRPALWLAAILGAVLLFWPSQSLRSDNFILYLPEGAKTIPIESIGHVDYLPLLQVLNQVVHVDGMQASETSLRVWFGQSDVEVHINDKKLRVNKASVTLQAPVRAENGEWLVPLDFMAGALPQLTRQPVQYRVGDRRVFIGSAKPGTFSVQLKPLAASAALTIAFSDKVTVKTEASNGRWILILGGHPLEPLESSFQFQNPYVKSIQFDDHDGLPKLIIVAAAEGLDFFPTLAADGKTLEAQIGKQGAAVAQTQPPPAVPPSAPPPVLPTMPPPEALPAAEGNPSAPVVILDPGHGGPDPGSHDKNGMLEKDLDFSIAQRVRAALIGSGRYRVAMTRSGDADPTLDRRDEIANVLHGTLFVSIHAGDFGAASPRAVIYTFQPPESSGGLSTAPVGLPQLLSWERVQESHLDKSRDLGGYLGQALSEVHGLSVPKLMPAPVRVLRSVNAPAVAIEVGSFAPDTDAGLFASLPFQQALASAILSGLDKFQKP